MVLSAIFCAGIAFPIPQVFPFSFNLYIAGWRLVNEVYCCWTNKATKNGNNWWPKTNCWITLPILGQYSSLCRMPRPVHSRWKDRRSLPLQRIYPWQSRNWRTNGHSNRIPYLILQSEWNNSQPSPSQIPSVYIQRAMALHKMIRLITLGMAGDAYLNFMGNEHGNKHRASCSLIF